MEKHAHPLHGIDHIPNDGWQVWSHILRYPVRCRCPKDAKRVAQALEAQYPNGATVDYTLINQTITEEEMQDSVEGMSDARTS